MPYLKINCDKSMPIFEEVPFLPKSVFICEPSYVENCLIFYNPSNRISFNHLAADLSDLPFTVIYGDAFVYCLDRFHLNLIKRILYIRFKHLRFPGNYTYDNFVGNRFWG